VIAVAPRKIPTPRKKTTISGSAWGAGYTDRKVPAPRRVVYAGEQGRVKKQGNGRGGRTGFFGEKHRDRRTTQGKSLSNAQRFIGRARAEVKSAVSRRAAQAQSRRCPGRVKRLRSDPAGDHRDGLHHSRARAHRNTCVPATKEYLRGDEITRPTGGEGAEADRRAAKMYREMRSSSPVERRV